jgi:hypothetical protein
MQIFKIESKGITPWGDYGHILQNGMAVRGSSGLLALRRTGPYIPPITFPGLGDVILTSQARKQLETSGLSGFEFREIEKALTSELHWESWDLTTDDPPYFPDSGEPEDYIFGQPNVPAASVALGELWEIVVPNTAKTIRSQNSHSLPCIELSSWNGADLFRSSGYLAILFTEKGRKWFEEAWGKYVEFIEFPSI